MSRVLFALATVGAVVVIVVLDRSPSDDAAQLTLLALLVAAAVLGAASPGRAALVGLVLGSAVAATHVMALALGWPEPGVRLPPGLAGAASLLVLVLPALAAAYAGATVRRLAGPEGSRPAG